MQLGRLEVYSREGSWRHPDEWIFSKHRIDGCLAIHLFWFAIWWHTNSCPQECYNCGMIEVPLYKGYCHGCICENCHRNAGEVGCSMNDMNWCNECEEELQRNRSEV